MKTILTLMALLFAFTLTAQITTTYVTVNDGDLTNITWSAVPQAITVIQTASFNVNLANLPSCNMCTDITYNYPLELIDPTTSGIAYIRGRISKSVVENYEFTVLPTQDNSCGENKTYVCHVKGNGETVTICVNDNAIQAHLDHGDTLGECE